MSSALKAAVAVIAVIVVIVAAYSLLTYPRDIVDFPVDFTVGAASEQANLDMPIWDSAVQVKVSVNRGAALWSASIVDSEGNTVWSHSAAQGEQKTYTSNWQPLAAGRYNFTFATVGAGSLDAKVTVTAKGGFW
jgi:hypothetical protein